jgi:hypothetical protein
MIEVKFQPPRELPADAEATGRRIEFPYSLKVFSPGSETEEVNKVQVLVSYKLMRQWNYATSTDLNKIVYIFVRKFIEEKLSKGTLQAYENMELNTSNTQRDDKLNPALIPDFVDKIIRI